MSDTGIVLLGAAGLALLYFSQGSDASSGGGGGGVPPGPSTPDASGSDSSNPLGGVLDAIKSFVSPSTPSSPSSPDSTTATTKKQSTTQAYASGNQTISAPNITTSSGPAYADSTGIHQLNFSSLLTGGPAYASPPINTTSGFSTESNTVGSKKVASTLNYTPAPINFSPAPLSINYTPVPANFSSKKEGAIFVAPPVTYQDRQAQLAGSSINNFPAVGQPFTVAGFTFTSPGQYYSSQMQAKNYTAELQYQQLRSTATPVATTVKKTTSAGGLTTGTYDFSGTKVQVKEGASGKYATTF